MKLYLFIYVFFIINNLHMYANNEDDNNGGTNGEFIELTRCFESFGHFIQMGWLTWTRAVRNILTHHRAKILS